MRDLSDILTLDLGTTSIKGTLFSNSGEKINQINLPTPFTKKSNDYSEIVPEKVLEQVLTILESIVIERESEIKAVIVSGMASSIIPVDRYGRALYPCICWNDLRTVNIVEDGEFTSLESEIQQYPMPMYLPFRRKWFYDNFPQIYFAVFKWLNITDYVSFHLSSEKNFITDYSQASRTFLFNSLTKSWNEKILKHFNFNPDQLPDVKVAGSILGKLSKKFQVNKAYNNTLVILGGHDHMCAMLGSGVEDTTHSLNSTGTSEAFVFPYSNQPLTFQNAEFNLENHVIDEKIVLVGYVASTGSILKWGNKLYNLFKWEKDALTYAANSNKLPLFILPGRQMKNEQKGGFIGSSISYHEQCLSYSIMEGICFESKRVIDKANNNLDVHTDYIRLVGGMSKSSRLLQLKATILGRPIHVISEIDVTSLGGFLIGGKSLNYFEHYKDVADDIILKQKNYYVLPNDIETEKHGERYERFLEERKKFI